MPVRHLSRKIFWVDNEYFFVQKLRIDCEIELDRRRSTGIGSNPIAGRTVLLPKLNHSRCEGKVGCRPDLCSANFWHKF